MSLSSAISTAQTIFSNTGLQSAALSRNIANASNPDYAVGAERSARAGLANRQVTIR